MQTVLRALLIGFFTFGIASCSDGGGPEDPGRMVLTVKSAPTEGTPLEGLEGIIFNVEQIEVILRSDKDDPSTERRIQLPTEQRPINLLGLDDDVSRLIGTYWIEPGYLTQMRFIGSDTEILFAATAPTSDTPSSVSVSLDVPSGEQTGIKVVPADDNSVDVVDQQTFFWEIQFDPNEQIIVNRRQGYKMKPVLRAVVKEEQTYSPIVPDQILVTFKEGVSLLEIEQLNAQIGSAIVGSYEPMQMFLMEFIGLTYSDAEAFYQSSGLTMEQTPSVILTADQAALIPNDASFNNQWGLHNTGQTGGTADADIDAPEGWNLETGGRNIVIAVLDTGVQLDHLDLAENIFINNGELPANIADTDADGFISFADLNAPANAGIVQDGNGNGFIDGEDLIAPVTNGGLANGIDNDGNWHVDDLVGVNFSTLAAGGIPTNNPSDDSNVSHGTAVSGIIGAGGNNILQIAGLNWRVRILPIKVCTSGGNCANMNIQAALGYIVNMGADVANMSLGATLVNDPNGPTILNNFANFLTNTINSQNVLIVVSAGNDSANCDKGVVDCFMAEVNVPNLIGVAATTDQDNLANFSNFGVNTIPISAPGRNIRTLNRFSGTTTLSGTSFSAPHAAGVAGLVLHRFPWLAGNPQGVIGRLTNGADAVNNLTNSVQQGHRLNAFGALQ